MMRNLRFDFDLGMFLMISRSRAPIFCVVIENADDADANASFFNVANLDPQQTGALVQCDQICHLGKN